MMSVYEFNVPMNEVHEVHEDLDEAKLLSEINKHMIILVDTYGRMTGMRAPPIEELALRMMMIVDKNDIPTDDMDGIIKGNEPANMSTIGILMDLEQVRPCTASAASTVPTSSVKVNVHEMSTVSTQTNDMS